MNGFSENDIFTKALGLVEPWYVSQVEFQPSEKDPDRFDVHITLDHQAGSKFPCPQCGKSCSVYDSNQKEWRHLNFFQYRCHIHARVPTGGHINTCKFQYMDKLLFTHSLNKFLGKSELPYSYTFEVSKYKVPPDECPIKYNVIKRTQLNGRKH